MNRFERFIRESLPASHYPHTEGDLVCGGEFHYITIEPGGRFRMSHHTAADARACLVAHALGAAALPECVKVYRTWVAGKVMDQAGWLEHPRLGQLRRAARDRGWVRMRAAGYDWAMSIYFDGAEDKTRLSMRTRMGNYHWRRRRA